MSSTSSATQPPTSSSSGSNSAVVRLLGAQSGDVSVEYRSQKDAQAAMTKRDCVTVEQFITKKRAEAWIRENREGTIRNGAISKASFVT